MSIVGTRPPLISETNLYEPHHKATINAFFSAVMTILVSRVSSTSHPTIQRLYQSITAVKYKNPCLMAIYCLVKNKYRKNL